MTALLLLMACSVLAGIPAALLVFATDVRNWRNDDEDEDEDEDEDTPGARRVLTSDMTQSQVFAYIVNGEGQP